MPMTSYSLTGSQPERGTKAHHGLYSVNRGTKAHHGLYSVNRGTEAHHGLYSVNRGTEAHHGLYSKLDHRNPSREPNRVLGFGHKLPGCTADKG
ncbi:hypothetical protein ACOMHN_066433 [Nucella lapillus]